MKRRRISGLLAVLGALSVVVLGATAAAAQAPEKEVISVEDEFVDEDLAEECGVDEVNVTVTGRVTLFTFPDGRVLQDLTTINLAIVWTAGDNEVRARDVGIDQVRVQPDGTVILSIVGQVLFDFTGVLKINLDTGDAILEPHHFFDIEEVCEQLTA
jgi:hypothetical protein